MTSADLVVGPDVQFKNPGLEDVDADGGLSGWQQDNRGVTVFSAAICVLQTDPRGFTDKDKVTLENATYGTAFFQTPSLALGNNAASLGVNPTAMTYNVAYTKLVTGTVNANNRLQIVTDAFHYDLWTGSTTAMVSVNGYYPGLYGYATPATTGQPHYFCLFLENATGSPISLTNVQVNALFFKNTAISL